MRYLHMLFPGGKAKAATFSYDDGVKDDIRLADTLTSYGLKCTFNLNAVERDNKLTPMEVEEHILSKGHEIAVHGAHHKAPGVQKPVWGIIDVLDCRRYLEEKYQRIIRGMAYPDTGIRNISENTTYKDIQSYLKELGIVYSRTLGDYSDDFRLPDDWYAWMPTAHHKTPELMDWIDKFLDFKMDDVSNFAGFYPRVLYIWGHSFEFPRDNNWDRLDAICQKIANRDDIWYATNIEIYEYAEAYKRLVFSAEGNRVYNPTLYTIWFVVDRKIFSIKSGETIIINK